MFCEECVSFLLRSRHVCFREIVRASHAKGMGGVRMHACKVSTLPL